MTSKSLWKAGLLAMMNAVLSIPFFVVSSSLSATNDLDSSLLLAALQFLGLCLFTYLVVILKRLLNSRYSFHHVDDFIDFIVVINLFFCIARLSRPFLSSWKTAIDLFSILMLISLGIAQILLGLRLMKTPQDVKEPVKPYGICTITTGLLISAASLFIFGIMSGYIKGTLTGIIISFILFLSALVSGSIRDAALGIMFFRHSRISEPLDASLGSSDHACNK